ncbi:MAG: TlpA disulfide reductase family protein [Myxococcota bacterium]|nr:TlpA disulfide reductase family protein [Myxococcota bacterium]
MSLFRSLFSMSKFGCFLVLVLGLGLVACGLDESSGGDGVCQDTELRGAYPEGPYGIDAGDFIKDMTFQDSEGTDFSLSSLHQDASTRLLLLSTGAGWCTACIEEQPQLEAWASRYKEKGLRVVMTVFEDALSQPATVDYAKKWKASNDLTIPVLSDSNAQFSAYYDSSLAPMNMIVEACTMKIVKIVVGANPGAIERIIEAKLQ